MAWDESKHPRDENGQFSSAWRAYKAAKDAEAAGEHGLANEFKTRLRGAMSREPVPGGAGYDIGRHTDFKDEDADIWPAAWYSTGGIAPGAVKPEQTLDVSEMRRSGWNLGDSLFDQREQLRKMFGVDELERSMPANEMLMFRLGSNPDEVASRNFANLEGLLNFISNDDMPFAGARKISMYRIPVSGWSSYRMQRGAYRRLSESESSDLKVYLSDWDESKHPRDADGRFATSNIPREELKRQGERLQDSGWTKGRKPHVVIYKGVAYVIEGRDGPDMIKVRPATRDDIMPAILKKIADASHRLSSMLGDQLGSGPPAPKAKDPTAAFDEVLDAANELHEARTSVRDPADVKKLNALTDKVGTTFYHVGNKEKLVNTTHQYSNTYDFMGELAASLGITDSMDKQEVWDRLKQAMPDESTVFRIPGYEAIATFKPAYGTTDPQWYSLSISTDLNGPGTGKLVGYKTLRPMQTSLQEEIAERRGSYEKAGAQVDAELAEAKAKYDKAKAALQKFEGLMAKKYGNTPVEGSLEHRTKVIDAYQKLQSLVARNRDVITETVSKGLSEGKRPSEVVPVPVLHALPEADFADIVRQNGENVKQRLDKETNFAFHNAIAEAQSTALHDARRAYYSALQATTRSSDATRDKHVDWLRQQQSHRENLNIEANEIKARMHLIDVFRNEPGYALVTDDEVTKRIDCKSRKWGPDNTVKIVTEALNRFPTWMRDAAIEGTSKIEWSYRRGHYDRFDKKIRCAPGDIETLVHEFGHAIEAMLGGEHNASRRYLNARINSRLGMPVAPGSTGSPLTAVSLSRANPDRRYDSHEVTILDDFGQPYLGKQYPSATEILSMGLETVLGARRQNPKFTGHYGAVSHDLRWAEDPDLIKHTLGRIFL